MDLTAIIRDLYAEREKLDRAISELEKLQQSSSAEGPGSSIDSGLELVDSTARTKVHGRGGT
jgi:hypothetical protein